MTKIENTKVVLVKISDIRRSEYYSRCHDDASQKQLAESIREHGFVQPVLLNSNQERHNIIIAGGFRVEVAQELGYKEVPAIYVDIQDVEVEKRLSLRLDRITGTWNWELLKDFSVETLLATGFDDFDLSNIWENVEVDDDSFPIEKELERAKITTNIKMGDLFALGPHRLICGDSTLPETVKMLVGDEKMDMVYTDPKFNIGLSYVDGVGAKGKYAGEKTDDNMSEADYKEFLKTSMINALSVCKPDCHFFYYSDERCIWLVQTLFKELGLNNKRVCLWLKNGFSPTPQIGFNKMYEPCTYATKGRPYLNKTVANLSEILNKEIGTGNRATDDILDLLNIWIVPRLSSSEQTHPTAKPPQLHEKPLRRCTKPGDNVLDIFAGSGSTLVACEQLHRRAFLADYEPAFCQLIIQRYEQLFNIKAKKLN